MQAFPDLDEVFYNVLTDRIKEKGFTDMQLFDAVNNVIDTCEYPRPVVGKFLSWDKKEPLFTHAQMIKMVEESGAYIWKSYDTVKVNEVTFWKKKTE